jgi:sulfur-carrier protein adenylyltransferase/sulfurtransferase
MSPSSEQLLELLKIKIPQISPEEGRRGKFVLLDVREPSEFAAGHIKGASLIPRSKIESQIERVIENKSAALLVYCAAGTRSLFAADTLLNLGYKNVRSLKGGFLQWREMGYPVESESVLSPAEHLRYARHLAIPELGEKGQLRLLKSRVLIAGLGGLGSPAAFYLAAAGVGTLGLLDSDSVDESNLQRQILHDTESIGRRKVASAAETLARFNPQTQLRSFDQRMSTDNARDLVQEFDLILDGTDNFSTRYLLNDVCVALKKPLVYGSVLGFQGRVAVYDPSKKSPCYRCIFPEPPPRGMAPTCVEAGVLGTLPGIIGTLQALEAIKVLSGVGEPLTQAMLVFDGLRSDFKKFQIEPDPHCPVCS